MGDCKKPVKWLGSSRRDLKKFPQKVRAEMGYALLVAQKGDKHPDVKPLQRFHGAGVLEVVDDFRGDTYRLVYTIDFGESVYALHAFKKKSHSGISTPKPDIDLIKQRYAEAEEDAKKEPDHE